MLFRGEGSKYSSPWQDPKQLDKSAEREQEAIWCRRTAIDRIHGCERDEQRFQSKGLIDSIETQTHVAKDGKGIFAEIDEMWKRIPGIIVTPQTLQASPDSREGRKKAKQPGVRRVALARIIPLVGVKTEEQLDVLVMVSQTRLEQV